MSEVLNLTGLGNMNVNPSDVPDGDCLVTKQFVDNYVLSNSFFVGQIKMYCGATAPKGWKFCNGELLTRSVYPDLSNVIGSSYGGNANSFNLPNLTSKMPICSEQLSPINITYQEANTFSSGKIKISTDQLTSHSHTITTHTHNVTNVYYNNWTYNTSKNTTNYSGSTTKNANFNSNLDANQSFQTSNPNTDSANTGSGKDYLPPFCVVNFIIYTGV